MPTTVSQKVLRASVVSSGIGTPYVTTIDLGRLTQNDGLRITQDGAIRIINGGTV